MGFLSGLRFFLQVFILSLFWAANSHAVCSLPKPQAAWLRGIIVHLTHVGQTSPSQATSADTTCQDHLCMGDGKKRGHPCSNSQLQLLWVETMGRWIPVSRARRVGRVAPCMVTMTRSAKQWSQIEGTWNTGVVTMEESWLTLEGLCRKTP